MLRRLALALLLLTALVLAPAARAAQPCCLSGCEAMPACHAVCASCASPALLTAAPVAFEMSLCQPRPRPPLPVLPEAIAEIWHPPD